MFQFDPNKTYSSGIPPKIANKIYKFENNVKYLSIVGYILSAMLLLPQFSTVFVPYKLLIWLGIILSPTITAYVTLNQILLSPHFSKNLLPNLRAPLILTLAICLRALQDWKNAASEDTLMFYFSIIASVAVVISIFLSRAKKHNSWFSIFFDNLMNILFISFHFISSIWLINCLHPTDKKINYESQILTKNAFWHGKYNTIPGYEIYITPWRNGLALTKIMKGRKSIKPDRRAYSYSLSLQEYNLVNNGDKITIEEIVGFFNLNYVVVKIKKQH